MSAQESAKYVFAGPRRINVGGVEKIDAQIERLTQERLTLFLIQGPGVAAWLDFSDSGLPIGHAAEADARDLQSGLAKIDVVHSSSRVLINSLFEMHPTLFCYA